MEYKGYDVSVYWDDTQKGYQYTVYNVNGKVLFRSTEAYFYEENARKKAHYSKHKNEQWAFY